MKTTLKRGYGRGASFDGNGRAGLPPSTLSVITRYRQPEPGRRGLLAILGRIAVGTILFVAMVALGLAGGAYLYYHQSVAAVVAHTPDVKKAEKQLAIPAADQAAIALVIGYDHRAGSTDPLAQGPPRSDTMMLIRADPATKTISLLSFPRDLLVTLYCPDPKTGRPVPQGRGKINGAYAICQSQGSLATVKELTGLPINYLITVDFHGFRQVVDAVNGVWLDVDRRYYNRNDGSAATNYSNIDLQPGYQRLDGEDALSFVRYRHTDSDLYRLARQQEFVEALKQQISQSVSPFALPRIVSAITRNVEVGTTAGGDLERTILRYAFFAYELPPHHFFQARLDNLGQDAYFNLLATPQQVQQAVTQFENPDASAPEKATAVALGRRLRTKAPAPSATSVSLLNGNGVPGSAANAAYELAQRGYRILVGTTTANAPSQVFETKVYYAPGDARAKAAAGPMANLFAPAQVAPLPAEVAPLAPQGAMLVVVVGQTFHGEIAPPPVDTTPKPQPPSTMVEPWLARDAVRAAARQLPFPAMLPSTIERSSRLDWQVPARVYRIEGRQRALRLVFVTGSTEYWGVEETDWKDAPILQRPSETHTFGGRTYDFYYTGSHLHMVVLHGPGDARYWVVNTLLDSLSNETMIAIARGLRRLG